MAVKVANSPTKLFEVSWNPSSVAANTAATDTITVTGLDTNMICTMNIGAALTAGLVVGQYWISAKNTLSITFLNSTAAPIDNAAITIKVLVH